MLGSLAWAEIVSENWPAAASALERAQEGMEGMGHTKRLARELGS